MSFYERSRPSQRVAGGAFLSALFAPESIAVVGASASPHKAGHQMLRSLRGFPGELYVINPHEDAILDVPAYPRLSKTPEPVDLAVLTVPPAIVPDVLRDGAACGLRAAVICAGGFAEAGPSGEALQEEVRAIAAASGIRVLGPNTSGFVNPRAEVRAIFLPAVAALEPGGLAVVAQSGGVNIAVSFLAHAAGVGIRLGVGLGNRVDVDFADVLAYLADDDETSVVALQVEGVVDGRAFVEAVRDIARVKPVVALTVGRADVGAFARSHTGALTADWHVIRAMLRQAGAVLVDDTTELVDAARALGRRRPRPTPTPGVGVVTAQAGPGLLIADMLRSTGVELPALSEESVERIGALLPPLTYQLNPVDTGRPDETFGDVVAAVARDPAIRILLVYALHEPDAVDLPTVLRAALDGAALDSVCALGGLDVDLVGVRERLEADGIVTYDAPERAARAVRALVEDARAQHRLAAADPPGQLPSLRDTGLRPGPMDEDAAKRLLEGAGIQTPARRVCATRADAHTALGALEPPVVVKILDREVTHKTDVGGVHVGIHGPSDLDRALDAIDAISVGARDRRYLVEEMAQPGLEFIVGGVRNPSFGPVVLVGVGGLAVEAVDLVVHRLAPLSVADAREMLDELPGLRLLDGHRGQAADDRGTLGDILCRVGDLLVANPEIAELDINPLRVTASGPVALDALVIVGERES